MREQTGKIFTYAVLYVALHFGLSVVLNLVGAILPEVIEAPVRAVAFKLLFLIYALLVANVYFGKRDVDVANLVIFLVMFSALGIVKALVPHSFILKIAFDIMNVTIACMFILSVKYGHIQRISSLPFMKIALAVTAVQFIPTLAWAAIPVLFCKSTRI